MSATPTCWENSAKSASVEAALSTNISTTPTSSYTMHVGHGMQGYKYDLNLLDSPIPLNFSIQATTSIVDTVIVESTAIGAIHK